MIKKNLFKSNQNTRLILAVTDVRSIESPGLTDAAVPPFFCEAANRNAALGNVEEVKRVSRAGKCFLKSLARNMGSVTAAARFKRRNVCRKVSGRYITTKTTLFCYKCNSFNSVAITPTMLCLLSRSQLGAPAV